jgi:hypothetical protein
MIPIDSKLEANYPKDALNEKLLFKIEPKSKISSPKLKLFTIWKNFNRNPGILRLIKGIKAIN